MKAPTNNNLGHNTTGGNINEPNVTYDLTGDVPTEKTTSELKSGNVLFTQSDAWVYEKDKLPTLK